MEKVDIQGGNATSLFIIFIVFKRQNLILKRDHPFSLPRLDGNERLMHQGEEWGASMGTRMDTLGKINRNKAS